MENLENKGVKAFRKFIFDEARMRAIFIFVKELEKVLNFLDFLQFSHFFSFFSIIFKKFQFFFKFSHFFNEIF